MKTKERRREGFLGQKMVIIPNDIRRDMQNNPLARSLYVTDIGYYPHAERHYRERKQGAAEYILIYCVEGHGQVTVDSNKCELIPNSYIIIPADTPHTYKSKKEDPWSIYWVHFSGSYTEVIYDKYKLESPSSERMPDVVEVPFEELRINLFDGMISLLERGYGLRIVEYVNLSLWQLLSSFLYHDFYSEIRHKDKTLGHVDRVINYMQENLDRSVTIEELADHLNYSASYLYQLFKKSTGYPPIRYFNHLKIQKACQYLSFTNLSVKEISFKLGFNDPFYFSRVFKKLMDLSPNKYREKYS